LRLYRQGGQIAGEYLSDITEAAGRRKAAAFERAQAMARRASLEQAKAQREEKERPAREKEAERQRLWQSVPARELRPVNPIVLLLLFALLVAPFLLVWLFS
jgi:hypothetical protein